MLRFTILIPVLTLSLLISKTQAQKLSDLLDDGYYNYVPNPSFEETKREFCRWNQNGRKYMESIYAWDSPTETTPDLLSTRSKSTCWSNPKKHSDGKQPPRNGDNMMGIKTHGKGGTDTFWHEYLMVKLDSTLIPGKRYYAEFYARRANKSERATNNLGMYFSDTAIVTRNRMPLFFNPQINNEEIVKSKWNAWTKVSGVFEADSEMRYLLIGNFYHDDDTRITKFPGGEGGAYYYIDDIKVRRAKHFERVTPTPSPSLPPPPKIVLEKAAIVSTKEIKLDSIAYEVGNTITLKNIFFEFDKATILPQSTRELEKLVDILTDYPHLVIEISGHTDNVGRDDYNQKLSEERAKSVVDYLLEQDVKPDRLTYKGYGSSKPIDRNSTESGRANNRRVSFTVLRN